MLRLFYILLKKGDKIMMAMLFACRIIDGRTSSFATVPRGLQAQVAEILINDMQRPDLVPAEYQVTSEV